MRTKNWDLGLRQWLLVRITAVFIAIYITAVLSFWVGYPQADLSTWASFLHSKSMRVIGVLAGLAAMLHACIGIWVVSTDYIKPANIQRLFLAFAYLIIVLSSMTSVLLICCF